MLALKSSVYDMTIVRRPTYQNINNIKKKISEKNGVNLRLNDDQKVKLIIRVCLA